MQNKTNSKKLIATVIIALAPLTYKICKDVYLMGVKDGKATHAMLTEDK